MNAEKIIELLKTRKITSGEAYELLKNVLSKKVQSSTVRHTEKEINEYGHLKKKVTDILSNILHVESDHIDNDTSFIDLGMDSISNIEMIREINRAFNLQLHGTTLYDYPNVNEFIRYLNDELHKNEYVISHVDQINDEAYSSIQKDTLYEKVPDSDKSNYLENDDSVAVIGFSCRFSNSENWEEYWSNLEQGKDCIKEIPANRWNVNEYYSNDLTQPNKINCKYGGFLDVIDEFDPLFFNISPREARLMDPQQRLFIEEAYRAIEMAGYSAEDLNGTKCGVFAGAGQGDYFIRIWEENRDLNSLVLMGTNPSILSTRLSYFLNLKGPSMTIDTACSSSLVAIHNAWLSVRSGESELAIAGGVCAFSTLNTYIMASKAEMLSTDGKCKTFDNTANGFVPGEGVGVVILKPLKNALNDRDCIYGIIKGSGINQDGKTNGITAPSGRSQAELETYVYDKFNINTENISYIETHGTGTKLGDPIEMNALRNVFRNYSLKSNYCTIGSVKQNIGHVLAAAGVAGFIKVLLAFKYKKIPASINFKLINEHIDIENGPFRINTETEDWKVSGKIPRMAAISSFGFSGTNCHMVLEEFENKRHENLTDNYHIIPLSAKTPESLSRKVISLNNWLLLHGQHVNFDDLAFTLSIGRAHFQYRYAFIAKNTNDIKEHLQSTLNESSDQWIVDSGGKAEDTLEAGKEKMDNLLLKINDISSKEEKKLNLTKIINFYLSGYNIDWKLLYQENVYKRIALPTYPFAREKYWVKPNKITEALKTKSSKEEVTEFPNIHLTSYFQTQWQLQSGEKENMDGYKGPLLVFTDGDKNWMTLKDSQHINNELLIVSASNSHEYKIFSDFEYSIDPRNQEHYRLLFNHLREKKLLPGNIVFVWSIDFDTPKKEKEELAPYLDNTAGYLNRGILAIYYLLNALELKDINGINKILFLHNSSSNIYNPFYQAISGYANSLNFIYPGLKITTIGIADISFTGISRIIMDELRISTNLSFVSEVLFSNNARFELCFQQFKPGNNSNIKIKNEGIYLIAGGLGGLGLIFSKYLCENYNARLVLTGRSDLDDEKERQLKGLVKSGGEVRYLKADITIEEDVRNIIDKTLNIFGDLNGIIHSAGIMGDKTITQKSLSEFGKIISPKIQGTVNLDICSKDLNLDFFILFSSSSAILGDFGQGDYAVANRFQDYYAEYRNQLVLSQKRRGTTFSINWPLWRDGGMHFSGQGEKLYQKFSGIEYLETIEGLRAFEDILRDGRSQVLVFPGDGNTILNKIKSNNKERKAEVQSENNLNKSTNPVSDHLLEDSVMSDIKQIVADLIEIGTQSVKTNENLGNLGFDSIMLRQFAAKLSSFFQVEILPTLFFNQSTIAGISKYLTEEYNLQIKGLYSGNDLKKNIISEEKEKTVNEPAFHKTDCGLPRQDKAIAVIGLAGKFPGSDSIDEFWQNLCEEKDLITEVPKDRWDWKKIASQTDLKEESLRWGGFISDIDKFDAPFFNISQYEAEMMDPQHRIFLETAWKAIEDSGHRTSELSNTNVGIFVGAQFNDYQRLLLSQIGINGQIATGNSFAMLVNRLSYILNLRGPSVSIDTACSSSLVAIHQAVSAIQNGDCEMSIAGGISLNILPQSSIALAEMNILSTDGKCRTFDKDANGLVKGEGIGIVILKRLSEALADNDRVYALIKGSAVNHGGRSSSLTSPNSNSQSELLVCAYKKAGFSPESIGIIETHGTATELGDPVEIEGIKQAFKKLGGERVSLQTNEYCALGALKTNIGHLEPASGVAGLIKVCLALYHKKIPGIVNFKELNPYITLKGTPFYVAQKTKKWNRIKSTNGDEWPLRAGVSSFGFGGVNAHIALEEFNAPRPAPDCTENNFYLILLSAKNDERLTEYTRLLLKYISDSKVTSVGTLGREDDNAAVGSNFHAHCDVLRALISKTLKIDKSEIENDADLGEYLNDRQNLDYFAKLIKQHFNIEVNLTDFAAFTTVSQLSEFIETKGIRPVSYETGCHSLLDIAYTLQVGRDSMDNRLAIIVDNLTALKDKLNQVLEGKKNIPGVFTGAVKDANNDLSFLTGETEGKEYVLKLVENKKLTRLAQLWITGIDINWNLLYKNCKPCRISLPTYPFAKIRCWISASSEDKNIIEKSSSEIMGHKSQEPKVKFYSDKQLDVKTALREIVTKILKTDDLKDDVPFNEMGADSLMSVNIVKKINEVFGTKLRNTDLFNFSTINALDKHLKDSENVCLRITDVITDKANQISGKVQFQSQEDFQKLLYQLEKKEITVDQAEAILRDI
jgi:acyl transferase domain-containing protein/acyl carrier protein